MAAAAATTSAKASVTRETGPSATAATRMIVLCNLTFCTGTSFRILKACLLNLYYTARPREMLSRYCCCLLMLAQIRRDRDHLRWMFSDNLKTSKALGLGVSPVVRAIAVLSLMIELSGQPIRRGSCWNDRARSQWDLNGALIWIPAKADVTATSRDVAV
jgi:hypothetical protein